MFEDNGVIRSFLLDGEMFAAESVDQHGPLFLLKAVRIVDDEETSERLELQFHYHHIAYIVGIDEKGELGFQFHGKSDSTGRA